MNKYAKLLPIFLIAAASTSGCSFEDQQEKIILRFFNCEDYIYEYEEPMDGEELEPELSNELDMMDQFVEYMAQEYDTEISYVYDTYDTNETMFNELKTGKSHYDVICTSDYMIQKLVASDMILPLVNYDDELPDAKEFISPYLQEKFKNIYGKPGVESSALYNYSVPYMWGTVGMMYNPENLIYEDRGLSPEDVIDAYASWNVLLDKDYKGTISIKDSVRDMYAVAIIMDKYESEILQLKNDLSNGIIDSEQFNEAFNLLFNDCSNDTIESVKQKLFEIKDNAFGFEVDSGKTDMVTDKVGGNICWSGDATWAIYEASEAGKDLYFSIPEEGSNIWFDGFCIPSDGNVDLAQKFINFMCKPENAVQNMACIGYTPGVAGQEILDYVRYCYDVSENDDMEDEIAYDLSYFFDGTVDDLEDAIIHTDEYTAMSSLQAQYPTEEQLTYLAVMEDFGSQTEVMLNMWEDVRTNPLPTAGVIVLLLEVTIAVGILIFVFYKISIKNKFKKSRREFRNS